MQAARCIRLRSRVPQNMSQAQCPKIEHVSGGFTRTSRPALNLRFASVLHDAEGISWGYGLVYTEKSDAECYRTIEERFFVCGALGRVPDTSFEQRDERMSAAPFSA